MADGLPGGIPLSPEQMMLEEELAAGTGALTVGPAPLTGEISGPSPYMLVAPAAAAPAPAAAAPPPTAQERVTAALGGPAALRIPQQWQVGAAPEFALPAGALRTATGELLPPSALPRVDVPPAGAMVTQYAVPGAPPPAAGPAAPAGPESDLVARARAMGGDRAAELVQQLQAQGVPEATIRARLGMAPGVMRGPAPAPPLPEELQRPYETLYPPDYASRVAAAAVAGDVSPEQAKQMMKGFEAWQQSPLGLGAAEAERQRGIAEQMGDIEQQQLAAQQAAAQRTQAMLEQQRATQEAQANEQRAWREDYDREMIDQTARYERAMEEAKRARVDPGRAKIPVIDALAIAMGQFAAILTGTPNAAMDLINRRLDRDVSAQEREIQTLEGAVAERRNRLGLLRQRLGDRDMAMQAEKRLQLEQVTNELNRIATTSEIEQYRKGAAKLALATEDQIQVMKAQEQMGHAVASQELANQRAMARIAAANQLAVARQREQQLAEMQATGLGPWQQKEATEMHKRYVPQAGGFVASEKQAAELGGALENSARLRGLTRELIGLAQEGLSTKLSPDKRARAEALWSEAVLISKEQDKLGVIAGPDMELESAKYRQPTKFASMGAVAGLQQNLKLIDEAERSALRKQHVIPGEVGQFVDPKSGEPQYGYRLALPGRGQVPQQQQQVSEMPLRP